MVFEEDASTASEATEPSINIIACAPHALSMLYCRKTSANRRTTKRQVPRGVDALTREGKSRLWILEFGTSG